ncbi:hypothetical protein EZV62_016610 [Acer yangbiense]|uniref:Uncharacterized protein n=1 Tax=Acer yangbiense TaxID=1000413 RepID=A0A5C7HP48_9ROSI|nr:hypothetical protein EZV62_016610 [Acer yangbiense]
MLIKRGKERWMEPQQIPQQKASFLLAQLVKGQTICQRIVGTKASLKFSVIIARNGDIEKSFADKQNQSQSQPIQQANYTDEQPHAEDHLFMAAQVCFSTSKDAWKKPEKLLTPNVIRVVVAVTFALLLLCSFSIYLIVKKSRRHSTALSSNGGQPGLSYSDISKSTNNFSDEQCIKFSLLLN